MLAQSAARAGIRVVALDHYADADTRSHSVHAEAIPFLDEVLDPQALIEAASQLAPADDFPLVYGSGLDSQPELLATLARSREVIGNLPATQRLFRSPKSFFALLRQCAILHPETRFERPKNERNWLIKSGCSEGGKRVRFCAQEQAGRDDYYQRRVSGTSCSALFLANGSECRIIGFNTLWTTDAGTRPFLFLGAINHAPLGKLQRQQIGDHIVALTKASGIKGLNSLDFVIDDRGELLVLEVNARPSATMALYDANFADGLLAAHIRACRGELPADGASTRIRAFRVCFSPDRVISMPTAKWPPWCADLPVAGSIIEPGQPLCTVLAEGQHPIAVEQLLAERMSRLATLLPKPHRPTFNHPRPSGENPCKPM